MAKFFTTKRTGITLAEVNVIPLVDCVFTLLIIFMVAAPMIHKGIMVQVPESATGETVTERSPHIVSITAEGTVWFDQEEVPLDQLPTRLQDVPLEATIYVQADANIPYGKVIDVIGQIRAGGLRNVGLITKPAPPKSKP